MLSNLFLFLLYLVFSAAAWPTLQLGTTNSNSSSPTLLASTVLDKGPHHLGHSAHQASADIFKVSSSQMFSVIVSEHDIYTENTVNHVHEVHAHSSNHKIEAYYSNRLDGSTAYSEHKPTHNSNNHLMNRSIEADQPSSTFRHDDDQVQAPAIYYNQSLLDGTTQNMTWQFNETSATAHAAGKWNVPSSNHYCNDTSYTMNHTALADLIDNSVGHASLNSLIPAGSGSIWSTAPGKGVRGTQLWVCNLGQWDVPFNLLQFNIVNDALDAGCGDRGGGVFYYDWGMTFGRDVTNDDGTVRTGSVCGYKGV